MSIKQNINITLRSLSEFHFECFTKQGLRKSRPASSLLISGNNSYSVILTLKLNAEKRLELWTKVKGHQRLLLCFTAVSCHEIVSNYTSFKLKTVCSYHSAGQDSKQQRSAVAIKKKNHINIMILNTRRLSV